jgi:hypothetical protein
VSAAGADKVSLSCTGWLPAYTSWEAMPSQAGDAQTSVLSIELDRNAHTLSTRLASTGELTAPLEVSDRYYRGTSALGRILYGRNLDAVEFSINRYTGESKLSYLVGETGYPAFVGNCAPARSRS